MRLNLLHRQVLDAAFYGHRLFVPFYATPVRQLVRAGLVTVSPDGRLNITDRGTVVLAVAMTPGNDI